MGYGLCEEAADEGREAEEPKEPHKRSEEVDNAVRRFARSDYETYDYPGCKAASRQAIFHYKFPFCGALPPTLQGRR